MHKEFYVFGDLLQTGRSSDQSSSPDKVIQPDYGAHPALYAMDIGGSFPRGKAAGA
jgi:hypothetical protein